MKYSQVSGVLLIGLAHITGSSLASGASGDINVYNQTRIDEISTELTKLYGTSSLNSSNEITKAAVSQLKSITNNTHLSECEKCVARLKFGHHLAGTSPDVIPLAWTQWCIETETDSLESCEIEYSRNTVHNGTSGSNFGNLLALMDPTGYDGQLYCYFREDVCDKPETPTVDLSYMWPEKKEEYKVLPEPGNETFNVLHVSDFHLELDYVVGGEANCTDSMCCTPHSVNLKTRPADYNFTELESLYNVNGQSYYNSSYVDGDFVKGDYIDVFDDMESSWWPALTFGNYECDAPEILINSSLKSIVEFQEKLDLNYEFAIFTGDLVDHVTNQYLPFELAVKEEEYTFRDVKFRLKDVPLYAVLGNHDTFPYAQLAQKSTGHYNMFEWNTDLMTEMWRDYGWINDTEMEQAKQHYTGFSTVTKRGLKVISLNANAWYQSNLYNYWNATNPDSFGQFQFLVDELVESEAIGQRVWIIAHIPFNEEALPIPAKAFAQIIERFSPYTISATFFGHTHLDQFSILYAGDGSDNKTIDQALNVAWVTQAVTPWIENNPAWRYYSVDSKTFSIMNSYNYYTKLNETFVNNGEEPVWEFEYSAREGYNISWPETSPLNASYWHLVAEKIKNDITYNQMYSNYETRFSPYTTNCSAEDSECAGNWCFVSSFTVDEFYDCKKRNNISESFY